MSKFGGIPVEETPVETGSKFGGVSVEEKPAEQPVEQPVKEDKFAQYSQFMKGDEQAKQMREFTQRDPSKFGKVPMSEYGEKITEGALFGGGTGALIGAATGPGAMATGGVGAFLGGVSGLAEAVAKDLGYGEGVQTLAGMGAGAGIPAKNTLAFMAKSSLNQNIVKPAEDFILSTFTKHGLIKKGLSLFEQKAPTLAKSDVESAIGVQAKSAGIKLPTDTSSEVYKFNESLNKAYPNKNTSQLYEDAKVTFDQAIQKLTPQQLGKELEPIVKGLPQSTVDRITPLFMDVKGNPFTGDRIIENLKTNNEIFSKLTESEQKTARKVFNDFLESKGAPRAEEIARKFKADEYTAFAKDNLPILLQEGKFKTINEQMANFAKDADGAKIFKQELAYNLKGKKVSDAQSLWANIGPNVNKLIVKDPVQFKKITDMINNAKTDKDINRAATILLKSGIIARQYIKQGEE